MIENLTTIKDRMMGQFPPSLSSDQLEKLEASALKTKDTILLSRLQSAQLQLYAQYLSVECELYMAGNAVLGQPSKAEILTGLRKLAWKLYDASLSLK